MNISSVTSQNVYRLNSKNKSNENTAEFYIPDIEDVGENRQNTENISIAADVDPVETIEIITGKTINSKPSYTVTEEEAEYFREKYGEKYNADEPFELFDDLAAKNIISKEDAKAASRKSRMCWIEGFLPPEYENNLGFYNKLLASGQCAIKAYYEKIVYGDSYEKYKKENDTPINTWQDYVQDNYSYYQYIRGNYTEICDSDGKLYISNVDDVFGKYCESVEKVQSVLDQIFG